MMPTVTARGTPVQERNPEDPYGPRLVYMQESPHPMTDADKEHARKLAARNGYPLSPAEEQHLYGNTMLPGPSYGEMADMLGLNTWSQNWGNTQQNLGGAAVGQLYGLQGLQNGQQVKANQQAFIDAMQAQVRAQQVAMEQRDRLRLQDEVARLKQQLEEQKKGAEQVRVTAVMNAAREFEEFYRHKYRPDPAPVVRRLSTQCITVARRARVWRRVGRVLRFLYEL